MPFRAPHSNRRLLYSRNDLAGPQHSPCAPAWTHSQQTLPGPHGLQSPTPLRGVDLQRFGVCTTPLRPAHTSPNAPVAPAQRISGFT